MTIAAHTNIIKLNLKELHKYSLFRKQDELNQNIWSYVEWLNDNDFPQSVVDVLLNLGSRSLRVLGISFPKQSTIAADTKYSRQTVSKAIKTLESLKIIDSVDLLNKWRKSGKVYRIKPFSLTDLQQHFTTVYGIEPNSTNELTLMFPFEPYQTKTNSLNNVTDKTVYNESADINVKDLTPFQRLKRFISNFTHDTSLTHRLYAAWKVIATDINDTDTLMRAVKVVLRAAEDKVTSNPIGYFKGIVRKMSAKTSNTVEPATQATSTSKVEREPNWLEDHRIEQQQREEARKREHELRMKELEKEGLEAAAERVKRKLLGLE